MSERAAEKASPDYAEPLRRAHSIVILASGDTPRALAAALANLAFAISTGKETRPEGASLHDDSDLRFLMQQTAERRRG